MLFLLEVRENMRKPGWSWKARTWLGIQKATPFHLPVVQISGRNHAKSFTAYEDLHAKKNSN